MNELLEQAILDRKLLEAQILSFYTKLYKQSLGNETITHIMNDYKEHFKINIVMKGIINGK